MEKTNNDARKAAERQDGYYWVKFGEQNWQIAHFDSQANCKTWALPAIGKRFYDSDFDQINETPITRQSHTERFTATLNKGEVNANNIFSEVERYLQDDFNNVMDSLIRLAPPEQFGEDEDAEHIQNFITEVKSALKLFHESHTAILDKGEVKYDDSWNKVIDGSINVPDYLDPLINKVGTQLRFHTISGLSEGEAIANIVCNAEKFFRNIQFQSLSEQPESKNKEK